MPKSPRSTRDNLRQNWLPLQPEIDHLAYLPQHSFLVDPSRFSIGQMAYP